MGQTVTLGGDRLGSGKKNKAHLSSYERSTHNLSRTLRTSCSAGTLLPFMSQIALPGDTWDIELNADVMTHPTVGPLFGSYKLQLDVFLCPIRLYNSLLHNNALGIGLNMSQVKLPQIRLLGTDCEQATDIDNAQINPSCILNYLGIRGVGYITGGNQTRDMHATSLIAYWDIYKNYYANKQEEIGAVIHTPAAANITTIDGIDFDNVTLPNPPSGPVVAFNIGGNGWLITYTGTSPDLTQVFINCSMGTGRISLFNLMTDIFDDGAGNIYGTANTADWGIGTISSWEYASPTDIQPRPPEVVTFDLNNIDDMRNAILAFQSKTNPFVIGTTTTLTPYYWLTQASNDVPNAMGSQEGLAIKTYQSDLLNNWLQTEWIDGAGGISEITAIDTSGGSFTIDALNIQKKIYKMLNRIAVSGATYNDWKETVYDHVSIRIPETPVYMGGLSKELVFSEVVSNSASETQPLGTLAGKGTMAGKHKGGKVVVKCDEPSYIIGIASLTPRVDYSQGNNWDSGLKTLDDLHKPELDEIGFQELITEQAAWWDTEWNSGTTTWVQKSAGKQPAWLNYMTDINVTKGNFAIQDNEMFMTLNRRYEHGPGGIQDMTTYIDPAKFNFVFAQTSLDSQNFWLQVDTRITSRRKMSAKIMPNL